jgi:hypothetical protein
MQIRFLWTSFIPKAKRCISTAFVHSFFNFFYHVIVFCRDIYASLIDTCLMELQIFISLIAHYQYLNITCPYNYQHIVVATSMKHIMTQFLLKHLQTCSS